MIVAILNYHSSIITIMVKDDNVLCINYTIKTGTVREQVRNLVRERCRPGSARSRSGNAEKFIRYTRGTFMPSFCILSSEKRHFYDKNAPVLSMAILLI